MLQDELYAAYIGVKNVGLKSDLFHMAQVFNFFYHCIVVGCIIHHKSHDLDVDHYDEDNNVRNINTNMLFNAILLQCCPHCISHVYSRMLTHEFPEIDKCLL
jgi:hypothetical protein